MTVVLLKNTTKELRCFNVGDRAVSVKRHEVAVTSSGSSGTRTIEKHVSSSITLEPGKWCQVPGIVLKQGAVQRAIAKGEIKMVKQEGEAVVQEPPVTVGASNPLPIPKGGHPVQEEGKVNIADFKKAAKTAKMAKKQKR